jgi:hypothetical protein
MRRRRGLFFSNTRSQIFAAALFGMLSSAYIWLPLVKEFEQERRNKVNVQDTSNNTDGKK